MLAVSFGCEHPELSAVWLYRQGVGFTGGADGQQVRGDR